MGQDNSILQLGKVRENEYILNVGPTCWTRLRQCVQHLVPTFRKWNDIVMTSLIACDCVAVESFFH